MFDKQAFYQQLSDGLREDSSSHLFLLFDSALNPEILRQYFSLEPCPEYFPLYIDNEELILTCPYIVRIQESTHEFLDWYMHEADCWGFIFVSSFLLEEQTVFWKSLTEVKLPDDSLSFLRFADGKIIQKLFHSMSEDERISFFRPCEKLYFQTPDKTWKEYQLNHEAKDLKTPSPPWFHLSKSHVNALQALSSPLLLYKIKDTLWKHYPNELKGIPEQELEFFLQNVLNNASSQGISEEYYLSLFAFLSFEFGEDFYCKGVASKIFDIEQRKGSNNYGESALAFITNNFTDREWQQLKVEQA